MQTYRAREIAESMQRTDWATRIEGNTIEGFYLVRVHPKTQPKDPVMPEPTPAPPRPSYVACVKTGRVTEPRLTWCGRTHPHYEWVFQEPTHAVLNASDQGRLLVCDACSKAMVDVLQRGTWSGRGEPSEDGDPESTPGEVSRRQQRGAAR